MQESLQRFLQKFPRRFLQVFVFFLKLLQGLCSEILPGFFVLCEISQEIFASISSGVLPENLSNNLVELQRFLQQFSRSFPGITLRNHLKKSCRNSVISSKISPGIFEVVYPEIAIIPPRAQNFTRNNTSYFFNGICGTDRESFRTFF